MSGAELTTGPGARALAVIDQVLLANDAKAEIGRGNVELIAPFPTALI